MRACRVRDPAAAIEVQRRLAIRMGGEFDVGKLFAQLEVVVDLSIGDQRRAARLQQRLVPGLEIDDGEPRLHHRDIAGNMRAVAVRAAVPQVLAEALDQRQVGHRPFFCHYAGDAAHYRVTRSKKSQSPG